jgi:hypothetical protein
MRRLPISEAGWHTPPKASRSDVFVERKCEGIRDENKGLSDHLLEISGECKTGSTGVPPNTGSLAELFDGGIPPSECGEGEEGGGKQMAAKPRARPDRAGRLQRTHSVAGIPRIVATALCRRVGFPCRAKRADCFSTSNKSPPELCHGRLNCQYWARRGESILLRSARHAPLRNPSAFGTRRSAGLGMKLP